MDTKFINDALIEFAITHHDKAAVAKHFGRDMRTISRWADDPDLGFPKPIWINGMPSWRGHELLAWEEQHRDPDRFRIRRRRHVGAVKQRRARRAQKPSTARVTLPPIPPPPGG